MPPRADGSSALQVPRQARARAAPQPRATLGAGAGAGCSHGVQAPLQQHVRRRFAADAGAGSATASGTGAAHGSAAGAGAATRRPQWAAAREALDAFLQRQRALQPRAHPCARAAPILKRRHAQTIGGDHGEAGDRHAGGHSMRRAHALRRPRGTATRAASAARARPAPAQAPAALRHRARGADPSHASATRCASPVSASPRGKDRHLARQSPTVLQRRGQAGVAQSGRRDLDQIAVRPLRCGMADRAHRTAGRSVPAHLPAAARPRARRPVPGLRQVAAQHRGQAVDVAAPVELPRGHQVAAATRFQRVQQARRLVVVVLLLADRQRRGKALAARSARTRNRSARSARTAAAAPAPQHADRSRPARTGCTRCRPSGPGARGAARGWRRARSGSAGQRPPMRAILEHMAQHATVARHRQQGRPVVHGDAGVVGLHQRRPAGGAAIELHDIGHRPDAVARPAAPGCATRARSSGGSRLRSCTESASCSAASRRAASPRERPRRARRSPSSGGCARTRGRCRLVSSSMLR